MYSDQDMLQQVYEEYQNSIPKKILYLEELLSAWSRAYDSTILERLKTAVHHLAGSAGTYGYTLVSEVCKLFERDLIHRTHEENSLIYFCYVERIKEGFSDGK